MDKTTDIEDGKILVEMKFTISRDAYQNGYKATLSYPYDKREPFRFFDPTGYGSTPEEAFERLAACVKDITPQLSVVCRVLEVPEAWICGTPE